MQIDLTESGMDKIAEAVIDLPGQFARARKSAMGSLGWWIRGEVRNHIEYGGTNWPKLHPMTQRFWSKRKKDLKKKAWFNRRRIYAHNNPLAFLGKFSRYRVDSEANAVQIDLGKSKKGQPGTRDPWLYAIADRAEHGERVRVTEAMRKFFGASRRKRPKKQRAGITFFPLKKSTKTIVVPKRPIFGPVWKKVNGKIPGYFERKFFGNLERYWNKGKKT